MAQILERRGHWSVSLAPGRAVRRPSRPSRLSVTAEARNNEGLYSDNGVQAALTEVASRIFEDGAAQLQERRTKPLKINRDLLIVSDLEFEGASSR